MNRADYDIVIIGTGPGGGTLAYALRTSGARILLLERGDFLPQEPQNWSPTDVVTRGRYKTSEEWEDERGRRFRPGVHYFVGGNSKFYGAALPRFRPEDLSETRHAEGISPAWPFSYAEIEPYYREAERLYRVHGADDDPRFRRSEPFPFAAVPHEAPVQRVVDRLRTAGYSPSSIPLGIDLGRDRTCIRCPTCDGFPCQVLAKSDADVCCVRPALEHPDVELAVRSYAQRILTDPTGRRAIGVEAVQGSETRIIKAGAVVVSCGAVNSAALLLRSATNRHPDGLANGSGTVGRHYMVHNNSLLMAINPLHKNDVVFQKTVYVNDFYLGGVSDFSFPLGQIQMIGKVQSEMLAAHMRLLPIRMLKAVARRSLDWWLFTEDLPDPENRVTLTRKGTIRLRWKPNNLKAHAVLTREASRMMRAVGFPIVFTRRTGIAFNSHQAGTVRAGSDPASAALDPWCRAHEVENLFVVDSSFFPSLPAMNPVLTIAANALRVATRVGLVN